MKRLKSVSGILALLSLVCAAPVAQADDCFTGKVTCMLINAYPRLKNGQQGQAGYLYVGHDDAYYAAGPTPPADQPVPQNRYDLLVSPTTGKPGAGTVSIYDPATGSTLMEIGSVTQTPTGDSLLAYSPDVKVSDLPSFKWTSSTCYNDSEMLMYTRIDRKQLTKGGAVQILESRGVVGQGPLTGQPCKH